ncbi:unnamed protein product [Rhizoctonia solani]|uniref:Fungal lipase-type domain-containing protein n=1 Tax=Rhizoctonia solani TaxID=456999 RepID=A0A8H2X393_9AGAM|nr:unnamed protein product [Rhizoctonia solani]
MEGQLPLGTPAISLNQAEQEIAVRHLDQLAHLSFEEEAPAPSDPEDALPHGLFGSSSPYNDLVQWSKDNAAQIKEAVKNRAFGGPNGSKIQWTNAFLCFMEAATVYLRDSAKLKEARDAYNEGKFEDAFRLYSESTKQIEEIAALWGMKFHLLCDLVNAGWFRNGPYCGAFYSKDPDAPFVGVVFKGTNIKSIKDIIADIDIYVMQSGDVLYNTNVSRGVFKGMFDVFQQGQAYDLIRKGLNDLIPNIPNQKKIPVVTHVAGHSLGGSYSNICFTQFTVPKVLPPLGVLGDLYTFGCPRIGYKDFAEAMRDHLGKQTGSAWRIANLKDPVTQVPPVYSTGSPFNHVDVGYRLNGSNQPELLPTEIGTLTHGLEGIPSFTPHYATTYHAYLQKVL